jgi:integrase
VSAVFKFLLDEGKIKQTPFINYSLKTEIKARGVYKIQELKNVFTEKWENVFYYLLTLIVYTTGLRNGEIEKLKTTDITNAIDGETFDNHFLFARGEDCGAGKTENI